MHQYDIAAAIAAESAPAGADNGMPRDPQTDKPRKAADRLNGIMQKIAKESG